MALEFHLEASWRRDEGPVALASPDRKRFVTLAEEAAAVPMKPSMSPSTRPILTSLLMSPKRGDRDALTAMLPEAVVVWARSIGDCVSALHGDAATIVFGDADFLVASPWISALLRSERLYTVTIVDAPSAYEAESSVSGTSLTRPLSQIDVRRVFEDASSGGSPHREDGRDLAFAMLLDEPVLTAGFQAMRDDLLVLADADEQRGLSDPAALKVRAHSMRTPAITLGFRRLEDACRKLEEVEDDATAALLYLRRVKEEAGLVLGGWSLRTSSSRSLAET